MYDKTQNVKWSYLKCQDKLRGGALRLFIIHVFNAQWHTSCVPLARSGRAENNVAIVQNLTMRMPLYARL